MMNPDAPALYAERLDHALPLGIHAPKKAGDVGYDLAAMSPVTLLPGEQKDIPVNARCRLPDGYWGEIRGRSSIARKQLQVDAGVLDNGYRGPLYVLLRNNGPSVFQVMEGDRLGQLILHRMAPAFLVEGLVSTATARSETGFGSTGL